MANKNFKNYAIAGNNVSLTYDDINDNVRFDVNVDKYDVGLGNVDNTSDLDKPISNAVQVALNLKEGVITAGTTAQYWRGDKTWQTLNKSAVGLGNVDNTSDVNKPISTATQTALDGKASTTALSTHISDTNNPHNVTKSQVGLGNVDNTSDVNKPISTAVQTALNGKQDNLGFTPVPNARTITINGISYDLTTNRSWSVGDLLSTGSYANPSWITSLAFSKITGYTIPTLDQVTTSGNTTTNDISVGAITSDGNISVTSQNGRYIGFNNFSTGMTVDFRFGDVNNRVVNVYGSTLGIQSYHGVVINNSSGAGVIGAALKIVGNFSTKPILELSNATTIVGTIFNSGNLRLQNGGTFTDAGYRLDVNGTARIQNQLTTTGSITAASAIARGVYMNNTLVAAANNDVLVGLDINPTFNVGSFTGTEKYAARITGILQVKNPSTAATTLYSPENMDAYNTSYAINTHGVYNIILFAQDTGNILFKTATTTKIQLFNSGNLVLQNGGTFTDAGYRLDVNGTVRIQNVLTLGSLSADPTGANGMIYYNTTSNTFKVYQNGAWKTITAI